LAKNTALCMVRRTARASNRFRPALSMKIAILKERRPHETRVAATPETVRN